MKSFIALSVLVFFMVALGTDAQYQVKCPPGRPGCFCPQNWDPVCSTTGCTYGNACMLSCAGGELAYEGECRNAY